MKGNNMKGDSVAKQGKLLARYGVIGNPIHQSKSPIIHLLFAKATAQKMAYEKLLAPLDGFPQLIRNFMELGGLGANVTVPFKEEAYRICDILSEDAARAGAVNTLLFQDGKILGDNTDGRGLVEDLKHRHQISLVDKSILLIGAGGAARGVIGSLLHENIKNITILNRTLNHAENLREIFKSDAVNYKKIHCCNLEQLTHIKTGFDLIINASSASLNGEVIVLPEHLFNQAGSLTVYDLMYQTELTPFLQYCQERGVTQLYDGLGMLVEQAALSFEIWRGIKPKTNAVYKSIKLAID